MRSISSGRVEADVLKTWTNFLEDTWVLQRSYAETKEKQVKYVYELELLYPILDHHSIVYTCYQF